MSKLPEWRREGWRPAGPGACRCPDCGTTVPTNALARASHARACTKARSESRPRSDATVLDINGTSFAVGDRVRRARRGSDVIPVESRVLYGNVRAIGDAEHVRGLVLVSGFIAWESPTNFERVEK